MTPAKKTSSAAAARFSWARQLMPLPLYAARQCGERSAARQQNEGEHGEGDRPLQEEVLAIERKRE